MAGLQDYDFIADRYYRLSIQDKLGPRDKEEMDSILQMATNNREFEFLLNEVDHMVAHDLDLIDPEYIQAQQKELENRLFFKKFAEQVSEHIQGKLRGLGLYQGAVDGFYGKETKQSVQLATKKVQKHLKQEKIYGGGIDGHCDLELSEAINRYKSNLNQDYLNTVENDILELSNIVCTQIPAFPDPESLSHTPTDAPTPNRKPRSTKSDSRFKWYPALKYIGISISLVGVVSALMVSPYRPNLISFQLYSPSSKMQNTAYKEGNDRNQVISDARHQSYTPLYSNHYRSRSHTASSQIKDAIQLTFSKTKRFTKSWDNVSFQHWKNREEASLKKLLSETVHLSAKAWTYNLQR